MSLNFKSIYDGVQRLLTLDKLESQETFESFTGLHHVSL
jgi:hypothetical protein